MFLVRNVRVAYSVGECKYFDEFYCRRKD